MLKRLQRLVKWLAHGDNSGVPAPKLFTSYEIKLLSALSVLACALLWVLARHGGSEGLIGVGLIGGLAMYLSYSKYYRTYRPAMDRWGIRELCNPRHPRQEYRVAGRDLEISQDEVKLIAKQHGVVIVCHCGLDNPQVQIYQLQRRFEQSKCAERWKSCREEK